MVIANIFGILAFLFLLWRTLKEDYQYERIFNLGFSGIVGLLISTFIFNYLLHSSQWVWVAILGMVSGFALSVYRQKLKFLESLEGFGIGAISWLSLVYLFDSMKNPNLISFLAFWVCLSCVVLYFFLNSHYRSFAWYKSGRVGFSGLVTLIVFFLVRIVLFRFSLLEVILSGSAALLLIGLLYNLVINNK